jgi:acetoin utilization protein AcuB
MHIPRINSVMTPFPYSVEADAPLTEASKMMERHQIHHLPVIEEGRLAGVVSQRLLDLRRRTGATDRTRVREIMLADPYIVEIGEPLEKVLFHLADHHLECALVVKDDRLAGIFTMIDAYRRYAQELKRQRTEGGGDDAA